MPDAAEVLVEALATALRTGQMYIHPFPGKRILPAELLRRVLVDQTFSSDPRGLQLRWVTVTGRLNLDHVAIPFPLEITDSEFQDPVTFRYASVPNLDLSRSRLVGIELDGTSIGANAVLAGVTITGSLQAIGMEVAAHFDLQDAILKNPGDVALGIDGSKIGIGAVWKRLIAIGQVSAIGVHIGAELDLQAATLMVREGRALKLDRTVIDGSANLDRVFMHGDMRAADAHIGSQLILREAEIIGGVAGPALNLTHARIDGGAFLPGIRTTGQVLLMGAHIGGQLSLRGADLVADGAAALLLDGLNVEGKAILADLAVMGSVRAISARITGQLDMRKSRICDSSDASGAALRLDGIRVDHGAFFEGLITTGGLAAKAAHISGGVRLQGATLSNRDSTALDLAGSRIEGDLVLASLSASGTVGLADAQVAGRITFEKAVLIDDRGRALFAAKLVANRLELNDIGQVTGTVDLTGASIDDLVASDRWPQGGPPGTLNALGWHLRDVHGVLRTDWRAAATWLDSGKDRSEFRPQPWHALADVYERNGQPSDARKLRKGAAVRSTRSGSTAAKPLGWIYRLLVGYGYNPLRASLWLILTIVSAWLIADLRSHEFLPTNLASARASIAAAEVPASTSSRGSPQDRLRAPLPQTPEEPVLTGDTDCLQLAGGYPCFSPILYAIEVVLPTGAATGQTGSWRPSTLAVGYVLTGLKAFAWLLTVLLLAGVTGLLRKT